MAKTKISEYSATSADNTDISNINIAEGCSPANVNNAIRTVMAQLKDQQAGTSGDPFTCSGTLTSSGTLAVTGALTLDGAAGTSGQVMVSAGSGTPTWSTLGTMASQSASAVAITGGTITGITDLTVADGGTGASTITANSVILGNGASALSGNLVAPSTSGNILTSNGTTWTSASNNKLTAGTSQATTSGTSISFTGIPSWVKRITVMLSAVSTNGSGEVVIKLGTSGGTVSSGYVSVGANSGNNALGFGEAATNYFLLDYGNPTSASLRHGIATLTLLNASTNLWAFSATIGEEISATYYLMAGGGSVTLSSVLTSVILTTSNGTDTFDAGSVNILYE